MPPASFSAVFAVPGDLATPTGGYGYARRVLELLLHNDVAVRHLALPGSFPAPSAADLAETNRRLSDTSADAVLLIDGLAYGALPLDLIDRIGRTIVALVHHPLGYETGLSGARSAELVALEKAALTRARRIIVSSPTTKRTLVTDFAVPDAIIAVAEPGTDPAERAAAYAPGGRSMESTSLTLLAVGTVSARKGYDVLVEALTPLADVADWRLIIVGARDRDAEAVRRLDTAITKSGLVDRITQAGSLPADALDAYYRRAHVFVLPSHYEGYGMVLAEAMVRGLPIVTTTGGAAAETVPDAAGLKVPPGDAAALRAALARVMTDGALRQRLADAAFAAGQRLPRWDDTARIIATVLKEARR